MAIMPRCIPASGWRLAIFQTWTWRNRARSLMERFITRGAAPLGSFSVSNRFETNTQPICRQVVTHTIRLAKAAGG